MTWAAASIATEGRTVAGALAALAGAVQAPLVRRRAEAAHAISAATDRLPVGALLLPAWALALYGALVGAMAGYGAGWGAALPAALAFAIAAPSIAALDLAAHRIPDKLTGALALTLAALGALAAALSGDWGRYAGALCCAAVVTLVFLAAAIAAGGGFGLADVKLLAVLALWLGCYGPRSVVAGIAAGFLLAGLGLAVRVVLRRAAAAPVPLAPFLLAGAAAAVLLS